MNENKPVMLSVPETAENFNISQHYARQLALSGKVKAVRIGRGKILINQQSVSDFFNNCYINAPEPEPLKRGEIKPVKLCL